MTKYPEQENRVTENQALLLSIAKYLQSEGIYGFEPEEQAFRRCEEIASKIFPFIVYQFDGLPLNICYCRSHEFDLNGWTCNHCKIQKLLGLILHEQGHNW